MDKIQAIRTNEQPLIVDRQTDDVRARTSNVAEAMRVQCLNCGAPISESEAAFKYCRGGCNSERFRY